MRLWVVILVPTMAFVVTFLTASPTTEDLRRCDNATVVILFSSGNQDGEDAPRAGDGGGDTCRDAAHRQATFVGGVGVVGGAASFVAFRFRRPRGDATPVERGSVVDGGSPPPG